MILSGGILLRQMEATDAVIDTLVYEQLYGLAEKVIKAGEGSKRAAQNCDAVSCEIKG